MDRWITKRTQHAASLQNNAHHLNLVSAAKRVFFMFDLERFKRQLAETIYWCAPRVAVSDPKNSLRTILPACIDDLHYDQLIKLVEPAVTIRSTLIEAEFETIKAWKKPIPPLPTGLAEGRLLAFYPDWATYDSVAEALTNGFFNHITIPAWDTWIYTGKATIPIDNSHREVDYLICWIPPQFVSRVDDATQSDPSECIEWLDKTKLPLPFLGLLSDEGFLA
jgi:hypothetical protein